MTHYDTDIIAYNRVIIVTRFADDVTRHVRLCVMKLDFDVITWSFT
jgi:hypothetical protein